MSHRNGRDDRTSSARVRYRRLLHEQLTQRHLMAGDLDLAFGTAGKVNLPITASDDWGRAIVAQTDGKFIVAGNVQVSANNDDFAVARFNANGTLDTDYGTLGKTILQLSSANELVWDAALQSDGKAVVVGAVLEGDYNFGLARFNTNGTPDTSFDTNGSQSLNFGSGDDSAYAVLIQTDGKLLVAGDASNGTNQDMAIARFNSDGSLDTTYGTAGKVMLAFGTGDDVINALAFQSDGKVIAVGSSIQGGAYDIAVARFLSDGTLDTSFGTAGKVTINYGSTEDFGSSVAVLPDDRIVIGGSANVGTNTQRDFVLARLTASGAFDNTFGTLGKVSTAFGTANDEINSLMVQPDGKLLAAGYSDNGSNLDFAIARYSSNGALDNTFDTDGRVTVGFGSGNDVAFGLARQNVNTVLVAGYAVVSGKRDFGVARLITNFAPTNLALSTSTVPENVPVGTTVGSFITSDADVGDTFSYSFVSGTGSTDNASFTIVGNELRTNVSLDFETKSSYSVRVRVTDAVGATFEQQFTITVQNLAENNSNVIRVAVVNAGLGSGNDAGYSVVAAQLNNRTFFEFTADVLTPSQADSVAELAPYDVVIIGNAGNSQSEDPFANATFTNALSTWVNTTGGGLVAVGYTAWGLSNPATETTIDNLVPILGFGGENFTGTGTISFSPHPITSGVGSFAIVNTGAQVEVPVNTLDSGATQIGSTSGAFSGPAAVVTAKGNGRSVYLSPTYVGSFFGNVSQFNWLTTGAPDQLLEQAVAWASTNPVITNTTVSVGENIAPGTLVATVPTSGITSGSTLLYEIVSGNTDSVFQINSSGQITLAAGKKLDFELLPSYTLTVRATLDDGTPKQDTATITVNLIDQAPAVTINQSGTQDPTNNPNILFNVQFTDVVTGFDASDIDFTGSTAPGTLTALISGSGANYTVSVSGMTGSGTVVASVKAGAATDLGAVNPSSASTSTDNSVQYDVTLPTVTSIDDGDADDLVAAGQVSLYVLTFSEALNASTLTAVDFDNAGTSAISIGAITPINASTYSVAVTPTTGGTLILRLAATAVVSDLAGNLLTVPVADDTTVTVDGNPLNLLSIDDGDVDNLILKGATLTYVLTFDKDVDQSTVSAIDFDNAGTATISFGAITEPTPGVFNIAVTAVTSGTITLRLPATANIQDLTGHTLPVPTQDDTTVGVKDAINVAIVRSGIGGTTDAGFTQAATFLNNDSFFNFTATEVTAADVDTLAELNQFDVVVLGNAGNTVDDDPFLNLAFSNALKTWVNTSGGGVVATGYTAFGIADSPLASEVNIDDVVPISGTSSSITNGLGTITIAVGSHPVTSGISTFAITSTGFTTVEAVSGTDIGSTVLGTTSGPNGSGNSIVVANKGNGRSVYLGPAYVGSSSTSGPGGWSWLGSGFPDRLFEQAVAWAATKPVLGNQSFTIAENTAASTVLGTASVDAISAGETIQYSILSGNPSGAFAIDANTGVITIANAAAIDFETNPVIILLIQASQNDGTSKTDVASFTVNLTNVNEAPTNLTLSSTQIREQSPVGTTVGTLITTDPDAGDTFSYSLVSGAGDTDNALFTLVGNQIKTNTPIDFETKNSYSIRVRSADSGNIPIERSITISVLNVSELISGPTIQNGAAQRSRVSQVSLVFDGAVSIAPGAFVVNKRGPGGGAVTTNVAPVVNGLNQTVVTLTFSGGFTRGNGLLVDGYYDLTVDGSKITLGGQAMDFNSDGIGGDSLVLGAAEADNFFARFGDTSGDGIVGIAEFGEFRTSFGKTQSDVGFNSLFDFENDLSVGISDFAQFRTRFGQPKMLFT